MPAARREPAAEEVDALDDSGRPVVVRRGEAGRRLVVPVHDHPAGRVDRAGVRRERREAAPVVLAGAEARQARVDVGRPERQAAARELGDVAVVGVEPVERLLHPVGGAQEALRRRDAVEVQVGEEERAQELATPRRALARDRHALTTDGRVPDDGPVHGRPEHDLLVRAVAPGLQRACVERLHRPALPAVEVVQVVAAAELLGDEVDDVRVGGGGAPRVVPAAADEHGERDARERGAARVDAAAVQVELHQDLREQVSGLRPGDEQRAAGLRPGAAEQERVAHPHAAGRLGRPAPGHEAAVVHDRVSALARPRDRVREAAGDGGARIRVVELAEVVPDGAAALGAEPRLERAQELGRPHLVAAAGAEDGADQRGHGDDVVCRPRGDLEARAAVVGVDPRHVGLDVARHVASVPALAPQERKLRRQEALGRRAGDELPRAGGESERVEARDVQRRDPARPAQQRQQEAAIGGSGPACAEGDVRPRPAVHVRHAPAVADDADAGARALGADGASVRPEAGGLEQARGGRDSSPCRAGASGRRRARAGRSSSAGRRGCPTGRAAAR